MFTLALTVIVSAGTHRLSSRSTSMTTVLSLAARWELRAVVPGLRIERMGALRKRSCRDLVSPYRDRTLRACGARRERRLLEKALRRPRTGREGLRYLASDLLPTSNARIARQRPARGHLADGNVGALFRPGAEAERLV